MATTRGNLDQKNINGTNPDNFSNTIDIQEETQAGIDNLKQSTIDYSLSTASSKSDLTVERTGLEYERDIHTLVGFLSVLDKLLEEIKDTKKGISKKGLSKAGKKTMDEAKTKLDQYEKILKGKKQTLLKQKRTEIYDNDIAHLKNLWEDIDKVRKDIGMGQWGDFVSTASYLYNSPETARKSNKRQADNLKFNQNFQEELRTGAISSIFNGNVQKANDFFRRIAQGEYTQADYQLYMSNSTILNPCFQRYGITIPTNPRLLNGGNAEIVPGKISRKVDYSNMDRGETLSQGGVAGVLDKLLSNCGNMTPGQRETWKSLGVLTCFAGGIYGLYKFYTNKKMGFWGKAGITAGVIFGSQALTGEGPISLINKLMFGGLSMNELKNKFGNAVGDLGTDNMDVMGTEAGNNTLPEGGSESASETIVPAMYSMMIFNSSTKVKDINTMTQSFSNNENRKTFYEKSCDKLEKEYGTQAMECFRATFSDQFDETKRKTRLASFGVTDSTDENESIYGLANNASMNKTILEKFKADNGLKENGSDGLKTYIQTKKENNQAIDIDDLNAHKDDWFELNEKATHTQRLEDEQNRNQLANMVDLLSIENTKKEELKIAIQEFYDNRTIETKPKLNDFSIKTENNLIILTSHSGEKAEIDINTREIVGFCGLKNKIQFSNLSDLLNVADLANKILETQRGKTPKDLPPFQYKRERRGICFNDATNLWQDMITWNNSGMDTRVLSVGRGGVTNKLVAGTENFLGLGGTTSKIENLYKYPNEFANYLSNRRIEESNKTNAKQDKTKTSPDSTIKKLSESGINFINTQEARLAESRLNKVKELRSMANKGTAGYKPFSIEGNKLVFSTSNTQSATKLYFPDEFPKDFPGKSQDLSSFPTIMANKNKFLNFMNNYNNGMRGSKLNQ